MVAGLEDPMEGYRVYHLFTGLKGWARSQDVVSVCFQDAITMDLCRRDKDMVGMGVGEISNKLHPYQRPRSPEHHLWVDMHSNDAYLQVPCILALCK